MNQKKIIDMFDEIAPTYDKANRAISFGIDQSWRKKACEIALNITKSQNLKIADVACGTGDLMGVWDKTCQNLNRKITKLVGVDPSKEMLKIAKEKFPNFDFLNESATDISLISDDFDIISISYGIRNVVQREKALKEFNRILKQNAILVVLEFTKRKNGGFISFCRDFYIQKIMPKIGAFISKNRQAYEYLPNSIVNFLDKDTFCEELKNNGFEIVVCKSFSFEVSTLFIAKKVKNCF